MSLTDDRRDARLLVGDGAVLSVTQAAELLGFRDAKAWLRREGLVSEIRLGERVVERVVWRRVLAKLEGAPSETPVQADAPKRRTYRLASV